VSVQALVSAPPPRVTLYSQSQAADFSGAGPAYGRFRRSEVSAQLLRSQECRCFGVEAGNRQGDCEVGRRALYIIRVWMTAGPSCWKKRYARHGEDMPVLSTQSPTLGRRWRMSLSRGSDASPASRLMFNNGKVSNSKRQTDSELRPIWIANRNLAVRI
jgi:hypothetical protein